MMMSSIKERNEITLSQSTIAIKGFVHAIQLVMVEVVPALLEVIQDNCTSESESDGDWDNEEPSIKKTSLSHSHDRDLHDDPMTAVNCIIPDDGEEELDETMLGWSNEIKDSKVDNMMRLINEEKTFCSSMFIGGATKADVVRMIKEAQEKNAKGKQKRAVGNTDMAKTSIGGGVVFDLTASDVQQIMDAVADKWK
ncbi:unnamed protein product [Arabis nemorensis]|uniref:Uncharacterized protein n=1 Tax=Arabis nemorensis TaxID=586526 RepID=A0A565BL67_9BRAS|nr:unnamed protein product [Arabis nemorensis]